MAADVVNHRVGGARRDRYLRRPRGARNSIWLDLRRGSALAPTGERGECCRPYRDSSGLRLAESTCGSDHHSHAPCGNRLYLDRNPADNGSRTASREPSLDFGGHGPYFSCSSANLNRGALDIRHREHSCHCLTPQAAHEGIRQGCVPGRPGGCRATCSPSGRRLTGMNRPSRGPEHRAAAPWAMWATAASVVSGCLSEGGVGRGRRR